MIVADMVPPTSMAVPLVGEHDGSVVIAVVTAHL